MGTITTHLMRVLCVCMLQIAVAAAAAPSRVMSAHDAGLMPVAGRGTEVAPATLALRIQIPGLGVQTLRLEPNQALQDSAKGFVKGLSSGRVAFMRGDIVGFPSSWLRLSRIDGAWSGVIHDGARLWLLDPASQHPSLAARLGVASDRSLIYSLGDLDRPLDFHGDTELPPLARFDTAFSAASINRSAQQPAAVTRWLRVSLVLDTEFQTQWGANAAATATAVLNIVDGFYHQVGVDTQVILYNLTALNSNGTLTSTDANALLTAFSDYSNSGVIPFHGLAQLLSGKNFDGATLGLAWVGVPETGYVPTVCDKRYGTGVEQITGSQAIGGVVLAHEMGHNYGSKHDGDGNACPGSGYIMAPAVSDTYNQFSSCSVSAFAAYQSFRNPTCLFEPPVAVEVIFADGFELD
ncbi:MAG TPA: M12 family metallo-peptidase [Chiayiivirga sp.]|nr:M12 family metallo-peptidase [Chiayiivirga sp.]